jgi:hypothetical protein
MATMLTSALASWVKQRPAMPLVFRIPSPIVVRIARPSMTVIGSRAFSAISTANSASMAEMAADSSPACMQKQMEYSLEDCEMRRTLTPARHTESNTRAAIPTVPGRQVPVTETIET